MPGHRGRQAAALVDFARGMAQAQSEETRRTLVLGVRSDPQLVLALDRSGASEKACKQAAVLDQAKAEVAAAEAAREAQHMRAASRRCPHEPALAARAPTAPVDEIVQVPGQPILARELNVVVIDQSRFDEAVKRFSADIQAAVEARQGAKAVKPTL